jgi:hypothetical protein
VLGYHSVHTSAEALQTGEAQIEAIRNALVAKRRLYSAPEGARALGALKFPEQERCP